MLHGRKGSEWLAVVAGLMSLVLGYGSMNVFALEEPVANYNSNIKALILAQESQPKTIQGLPLSTTIFIAGGCVFFAVLTSWLFLLQNQLRNHVRHLRESINLLQGGMGGLQDQMNRIQDQMQSLQGSIDNLTREIQKRWPKG